MKYFEVEMAMSFTKTIHVKAPNEEAAEALAETIFKDTDVLSLTPADLEDFDAFAMPVDDSDDDEDQEDICYEGFDEDEELPFDGESDPRERLLEMMESLLNSLSDHEVAIHIYPTS